MRRQIKMAVLHFWTHVGTALGRPWPFLQSRRNWTTQLWMTKEVAHRLRSSSLLRLLLTVRCDNLYSARQLGTALMALKSMMEAIIVTAGSARALHSFIATHSTFALHGLTKAQKHEHLREEVKKSVRPSLAQHVPHMYLSPATFQGRSGVQC